MVAAIGGVALLLSTGRPARVTVPVDDDQVHVRLHGWDAVLCLRRQITVPVAAVDGVCVSRRDHVPAAGIRLPGTSIPGTIRAGSFGIGDRRDFWEVRRAQQLLVIQMTPGAAEYRRIVLEVSGPRAELGRVRPRLGPTVLPTANVR